MKIEVKQNRYDEKIKAMEITQNKMKGKVKILSENDIKVLMLRKKAIGEYLKGNITKKELKTYGARLKTPLSV